MVDRGLWESGMVLRWGLGYIAAGFELHVAMELLAGNLGKMCDESAHTFFTEGRGCLSSNPSRQTFCPCPVSSPICLCSCWFKAQMPLLAEEATFRALEPATTTPLQTFDRDTFFVSCSNTLKAFVGCWHRRLKLNQANRVELGLMVYTHKTSW